MKTITAYTASNLSAGEYYPPYINVSETDYGSIRIIIRPHSVGNSCAHPVEIVLPRKDAMRLFTDAFSEMMDNK